MPRFRPDPTAERPAALRHLARAAVQGALALLLPIAVARFWPTDLDALVDPGTRETVLSYVVLVLAGLAVLNLLAGTYRAVRWARGARWQRMLADPEWAASVPPLEAHTAGLEHSSTRRAAGGFLRLAVVIAGIAGYQLLARSGRVPLLSQATDGETSEWMSQLAVVVVPLALLWLVWLVRAVPRWRLARTVEQLSEDLALGSARPGATASVSPRRATLVPSLAVSYRPGGDPGSVGLDPAALASRPGRPPGPLHIVYFRLFDNVDGTKRFLAGGWRRHGYVHLLRSASQVEADEVDAARRAGSVARLFITSAEQLDAELARQETARHDPEPPSQGLRARWSWATDAERGRYPVVGLLCHGTFWQEAVDLLLERMDLVVLDLSGYRPEHGGTRFEMQRVVDRFPIERVLFLAQASSDQAFLTAQLRAVWSQMAEGSPNAGAGSRSATVAVDASVPVPAGRSR